jgi:hypothetical protein
MSFPYLIVTPGGCKLIRIIPTIIICFLLYYIYYNCKCNNNSNKKENFTPNIRETYRPYLRHARLTTDGIYGNHKNKLHNFFRRFGLY